MDRAPYFMRPLGVPLGPEREAHIAPRPPQRVPIAELLIFRPSTKGALAAAEAMGAPLRCTYDPETKVLTIYTERVP